MEKELRGKEFTLFSSSEDMNDVIKIIKLLEDFCALFDGVAETVNHKIKKKQERKCFSALLTPLAASVVQPVFSLVVKVNTGRGVRRSEGLKG